MQRKMSRKSTNTHGMWKRHYCSYQSLSNHVRAIQFLVLHQCKQKKPNNQSQIRNSKAYCTTVGEVTVELVLRHKMTNNIRWTNVTTHIKLLKKYCITHRTLSCSTNIRIIITLLKHPKKQNVQRYHCASPC